MRTKKGVVTSAKMTGTVTVTTHRHVFHPVYKKRYRKSKKFLCDSNKLDLYAGDEVLITECKPISKNKHFMVTEILKAVPRVAEIKEDKEVEEVLNREKKGADEDAKAKKEKEKAKADKKEGLGASSQEPGEDEKDKKIDADSPDSPTTNP
ncbi:MAG: 30S ribosomal protein S17 [Candidatus Peribacteraceae bacterium]|jgi:small subunit ribosomal protein S17|nr:30S ribosomal protein S17 [Candidatus Peribacteraceae bacterium]